MLINFAQTRKHLISNQPHFFVEVVERRVANYKLPMLDMMRVCEYTYVRQRDVRHANSQSPSRVHSAELHVHHLFTHLWRLFRRDEDTNCAIK